jgi:hypothetical protein
MDLRLLRMEDVGSARALRVWGKYMKIPVEYK